MVAALAMMFSIMTSYARARAESLIEKCKVGFMERPERIVLFMIGAFTDRMAAVLWVILILSIVTVANRIHYTYLVLNDKPIPERVERADRGVLARVLLARRARDASLRPVGDRDPGVRLAHAARLAARPDGVRPRDLGLAQIGPRDVASPSDAAEASRILRELSSFGPVLAIKLYRLTLDPAPAIPTLPCLDHEAMLHEGVAPHAGRLHSGCDHPAISTSWCSFRPSVGSRTTPSRPGANAPRTPVRVCCPSSGSAFRTTRLSETKPSWWRGDRRVATACRAQVTLRDVLLGTDIARVKNGIDRLQTIAALMEKQSRVASWGVRTVSGPFVAAGGVIVYFVFGALSFGMSESAVNVLRYLLIGLLGGWFLYYGVKAVQLTEMSNRVWKRTAEYNLILSERKRLGQ